MKAVYEHEVSSYFGGITAYVFGAFLLLFAGIYTFVINIRAGVTNFEYVLNNMSFIFLVIVPILTMRVIADERRQKTDQLLYSLPLTMTQVVLGKYFALLTVNLIPTIIMCIYPLILSFFGTMNFLGIYTTVIGFFLLGSALIAVGMFISSITESQPVAAGVCFVVVLINYFISSLSTYISSSSMATLIAFTVMVLILAFIFWMMTRNNFISFTLGVVLECILLVLYMVKGSSFEGLFPAIVEKLSLFDVFYGFVDGIFSIGSVVYFLSIIAVFVFLTIQSLEKRRWSE